MFGTFTTCGEFNLIIFSFPPRQENGRPITIFFDLEGCGLSNMDLDVIKYLINLFKLYYPFFLNYIIVYEMAWILSGKYFLIYTMVTTLTQ